MELLRVGKYLIIFATCKYFSFVSQFDARVVLCVVLNVLTLIIMSVSLFACPCPSA